MRAFDAVVLGLGGIGSASAYWLARRGLTVAAFEQFQLGHARGESHDHTRIIRLSYHAPHYVQLAKQAYAAWASVEEHARVRLVHKTGGLDLGPHAGAIPLEGYAGAMRVCEVPFEWLETDQIRRRFPQFAVAGDVRGLFQPDGGFVAAERATSAHQRLAAEMGASMFECSRVLAIGDRDGEIELETQAGRFVCRNLVIAAGPWTNGALRHFGFELPVEVTKEQPMYFAARDLSAFAPERFPVWIWMDDPSFYGFPAFGEPAVKVTQDAGGKSVDPDTRDFEPDRDISARVTAFVRDRLPDLGAVHLLKTCLYTLTPDRDFVIDTLPGHANVHVAVGAGHAFKFASVIGRILSDLAVDGTTACDIAPFAIDRAILQMQSPPKTYMV